MEKKERVYQSVVNADYKRFVQIAERRTGIQIHRQLVHRSTPQVMCRRMIYAYMIEVGHTYKMIATASGLRNHTTILHHKREHEKTMAKDTLQAQRYRAVYCELRLSFMRGSTPDVAVVGRKTDCSPYIYPGIELPVGLDSMIKNLDT